LKNETTVAGAQPAKALQDGQGRLLGLNDVTGLGSNEAYSGAESSGQTSAAEERPSEQDIQRAELGPRGKSGNADQAEMTPQREKKTPTDNDPGQTA
jgi:hypothetical protein